MNSAYIHQRRVWSYHSMLIFFILLTPGNACIHNSFLRLTFLTDSYKLNYHWNRAEPHLKLDICQNRKKNHIISKYGCQDGIRWWTIQHKFSEDQTYTSHKCTYKTQIVKKLICKNVLTYFKKERTKCW